MVHSSKPSLCNIYPYLYIADLDQAGTVKLKIFRTRVGLGFALKLTFIEVTNLDHNFARNLSVFQFDRDRQYLYVIEHTRFVVCCSVSISFSISAFISRHTVVKYVLASFDAWKCNKNMLFYLSTLSVYLCAGMYVVVCLSIYLSNPLAYYLRNKY